MESLFSFDDVLIVPQYSEVITRRDCDTSVKFNNLEMDIPVFAANMDTICGVKMVKKMKKLGGRGIIHRYMQITQLHNIFQEWFSSREDQLIVSVGSINNDKRRIDLVCDRAASHDIGICVDIAHGDSVNMTDTLDYLRHTKKFQGLLIAGNVCTYSGACRLFDKGADIVKVGVGPGSACTTRIKTGCGFPQLAAIDECSKVGPIIADGGIRTSGDAAKALACGAKAVMLGGMLAGTDCTPQWNAKEDTVEFRGMASKSARESCGNASNNTEGISTRVPRRDVGSTQQVVHDLMEGIRSSMSYSGAKNLDEFSRKAVIIKVNSSIIRENTPHILK